MLYYFDLREGPSVMIDDVGQDLRDRDTAQELAIRTVGEMLSDRPFKEREIEIDVREERKVVLTVQASVRVRN
jgi:hypothetical protein